MFVFLFYNIHLSIYIRRVKIVQRYIRKHQQINIARIELLSLYLHDNLPLLTSTVDIVLSNNHVNNNTNNNNNNSCNNNKDNNKTHYLKNIPQNQNRRKHHDRLKHLSNQFQAPSLNLFFKDYSENILRDFVKFFIKNKDNTDIPIKIKYFFLLEILTNCRYLYIKDMEKKANTFIFTAPIINYEQAQQFIHDGKDIISNQMQSIINQYDNWYRDLQRKRLGLKHPVVIEIDKNNKKLQQQQQQQFMTYTTNNEYHTNINLTDDHIAIAVKGVISALDLNSNINNSTDTCSSPFSYNSKRKSRSNKSISINHQNNNNYNNSNSSHNGNNVKTKTSSTMVKRNHHHQSSGISNSNDDDDDDDDDNIKVKKVVTASIEKQSLLLLHSVTIEAMISYYMKITEYIQRMKEIQVANRRERHNNHIYSNNYNNNSNNSNNYKDSNNDNNNNNNDKIYNNYNNYNNSGSYNSNNSQNNNSDVNHKIFKNSTNNNFQNSGYLVSNITSASNNKSNNFIIPQPPTVQKIHTSKPTSTRLTKINNHFF